MQPPLCSCPWHAELVPALLALCQEHPEPAGRRQLAGLLFSLIKKPNTAQARAAHSWPNNGTRPACSLYAAAARVYSCHRYNFVALPSQLPCPSFSFLQRSLITGACVQLGRRVGGSRLMLDLLPHLHGHVSALLHGVVCTFCELPKRKLVGMPNSGNYMRLSRLFRLALH